MFRKITTVAASAVLLAALGACGSDSGGGNATSAPAGGGTTSADTGGNGGGDSITMGFSQVGAESGWRTANTVSIQEAAEEAGIDLKFSDAQGEQANQISAIRSFIEQGVDVIAFSPVVEDGFEEVLQEAADAGIPVVLTDRAVNADESLYVSFLGSDFVEEGRKAGQWLVEQVGDEEVTVVEMEGTVGSAPANDRKSGFAEIVGEKSNIKIIEQQSGNFTRTEGKQVMEAWLQKHGDDIDYLYAHNDDMALGAIEAIEAAGLTPGEDIKIISVDAVKAGMEALAAGKINFIVECSPLLGPQLMDIAKAVVAGEEVEKRIVTEETTFTQEEAIEALPDRKY